MEESEPQSIEIIETVDYPHAITAVLSDSRMQRTSWNSAEWIFLADDVADFASFIGFKPVTGDLVPYIPSNDDIFADDWQPIK